MAPSPARACWDSEPESAAGRAGPPPAGGRVDVTPKAGGGGHPRICQVRLVTPGGPLPQLANPVDLAEAAAE
jgi:hypothetical protein